MYLLSNILTTVWGKILVFCQKLWILRIASWVVHQHPCKSRSQRPIFYASMTVVKFYVRVHISATISGWML